MASLFRMFSKDKADPSVIKKRNSIVEVNSVNDHKNASDNSNLTLVAAQDHHFVDKEQKLLSQLNSNHNINNTSDRNGNQNHNRVAHNMAVTTTETLPEPTTGAGGGPTKPRKLSLIGKLRSLPMTNQHHSTPTPTMDNGTNTSPVVTPTERDGVKQPYTKGGKIEKINYLTNSKSLSLSKDSLDDDNDLPEELCDLPTFLNTPNCDKHLIDEARRLLTERFAKNPDSFYQHDYDQMLQDDWTVSRFLLRRRQDPKRTAKLMEECGRFRKTYKMSEVQLWEFPREFHQAGGLFRYAKDRVGNVTLYMRTKMYRRVPEISDVFKAFILCVLEECDKENNGRGVAVIFDLTSCGLQNVDLGFLSWLLSAFRNYCPKGVSYIIVYNLPWILNATCKLAMSWMSVSNRRCLRFVHGDEILSYITKENLPDYLGGTCEIDYRAVPEGSLPAEEVCDRIDITKEQALKIKELFREYLPPEPGDDDELNKQQVEGGKRRGSRLSRFWSSR